MELDNREDNRYYEALYEGLFPTLKEFDLKEEIDKVVNELKTIFKDLQIEYHIRYGGNILFHIEKVNTYILDHNISSDLLRFGIPHKDDLKRFLVPEIKYALLEYWDSKILIKKN